MLIFSPLSTLTSYITCISFLHCNDDDDDDEWQSGSLVEEAQGISSMIHFDDKQTHIRFFFALNFFSRYFWCVYAKYLL
jgi:hypothetical protein